MNKTIKWILAVFWTAFIIYGLTKTPSGAPKFWLLEIEGVDKLIHAIIFGIEAALLMLATERNRLMTVLIVGWCILLGGTLEWVQLNYVEGRSGDVFDLIADALGAVIGVVVFAQFAKR